MNLPNKLTVSRFVLTAFFLLAVFWRSPVNDTVALLIFIAASLTDYFDGRIAEDFKLDTGTWVQVGPLRAAFIDHCAPLVQDVVFAGPDREFIGALVFVHELGHFAWAKTYGIKVLKFSLGFGPRL